MKREGREWEGEAVLAVHSSLRFTWCSDSAHFGNGEPRPPKDGNGNFSNPTFYI